MCRAISYPSWGEVLHVIPGHMFRFIDGPIAELVFLDEDEDEPQRRGRVPRPNDTTPRPPNDASTV